MRYLILVRTAIVTCAVAVVIVSAGCGRISLTDLPEEIQYVVSNEDSFAQNESGPLADTEPGTVIDDLAGIDGCWGAYRIRGEGGGLQDNLSHDLTWQNEVYAAYRFDVSAGRGTFQQYTRATVLGVIGASIDTFTFAIAEEDRIDIDISTHTYSAPVTGTLVTYGPEDVGFPLSVWEHELLVTVNGERMRIEGSGLVFHRFECLE